MIEKNKKYKHIISLGFFCSVALETERMGLRDSSMPFDWLISSWEGVEKLILNSFEGFLDDKLLKQSKEFPERYKNIKYDIWFFHDFNAYASLESQMEKVVNKYQRRIERFYQNIEESSLFIRYIRDEEELRYLEKNIDRIEGIFRRYNPENHIIFIANNEITSDIIEIYNVEKDNDDSVARKPFDKNNKLYDYLLSVFDENSREKNRQIYITKQKQEKNFVTKYRKKIIRGVKKIFLKPYRQTE